MFGHAPIVSSEISGPNLQTARLKVNQKPYDTSNYNIEYLVITSQHLT